MSDLQVTIDHEFMTAEVEGYSDSGVDFIDSYLPQGNIQVVDSGRIIIPSDELAELEQAADELDLSIRKEAIR